MTEINQKIANVIKPLNEFVRAGIDLAMEGATDPPETWRWELLGLLESLIEDVQTSLDKVSRS